MRKLAAMTDGWQTSDDITTLERDLVLEKLRRLYDAVRFADPMDAVAKPQSEPEVPEADIELEGVIFIEEAMVSVPEVDVPDTEPELEVSAQAEPLCESAAEPEVDVPAEVEPQSEPDEQTEVLAEAEPQSEPVAETIPEPEFDSVSGTSVGAAAESEPQYAPGNLFGGELEVDSHRRKQRVIMSLYGSEPEEPSRPVAVQTPKAEVAPVVVKEPEVLEVFGDEEPADELEEIRREYPQARAVSDASDASEPEAVHPTVLGEVMNHDVRTLGDTFTPLRDTLSEAIHHTSVADLSAALGLNDRFLLARDLFEGNIPACNAALEALNAYDNLDDCMIHIAEHYAWNPDSDGAKLLMDLLERKYA